MLKSMSNVEIPPAVTRLLRKSEVCRRVTLSAPTIWRLERAGKFPQSIRISPGAVAWRESDIEALIAERARSTK
jgi:prophage regulatory protein